MRKKRRRLWEGGKTLLILLLTASAIYLAGLTLFPGGPEGLLARLPQQSAPPAAQSLSSGQTLRPAILAATRSDGRYGLLPFQEDQEAYARFSTLLADALSNAGAPAAATQAVWEEKLSQPSLFCEYLGSVPLDALARWLSGQENPALSGFSADRLCISGSALLFAGTAGAFSCPLPYDLTPAIGEYSLQFTPNGASFSFENPGKSLLRPDSLILDVTPVMPQLSASNPVTVTPSAVPGDTLLRILQVLAFHPQTNPLYAITGGYAITDGSHTLRISSGGQLSFRQSPDGVPRYTAKGDDLDLTLALAERTVGVSAGAAQLYLQSVTQEGGVTTVTYGYSFRGAIIHLEDPGWAAQFTLENGVVTAFTLRPRQYTLLDENSVVMLPQEQAAAALSGARNQVLRPVYLDDGAGEAMSPFWADVH